MGNIVVLIPLLEKIVKLLLSVEEDNWSAALENFRDRCNQIESERDVKILQSEILRIYGGMGSFSDLVLYSRGKVLVEENQKLDELRKELFEAVCENRWQSRSQL